MKLDLEACIELAPKHTSAQALLSLYSKRPIREEFGLFPGRAKLKVQEIEAFRALFQKAHFEDVKIAQASERDLFLSLPSLSGTPKKLNKKS